MELILTERTMKQQHTPGPWTATIYGKVENAGGNTIAACAYHLQWQRPDGGIDSEELPYEANARLMAAAPELLEALNELRESCLEYNPNRHIQALRVSRDLIAKIEGNE